MRRSGIREILDLAAGSRRSAPPRDWGAQTSRRPPHVVEAAARAAADGYTKYTANRGLAVAARGDLRQAGPHERHRRDAGAGRGHDGRRHRAHRDAHRPRRARRRRPHPGSRLAQLRDDGRRRRGRTALRYPLDPASRFEPDLDRAGRRSPPTPGRRSSSSTARPTPRVRSGGRETIERVVELAAAPRPLGPQRRGLRGDRLRGPPRQSGHARRRRPRDQRLQRVQDLRDDRLADRLPRRAGAGGRPGREGPGAGHQLCDGRGPEGGRGGDRRPPGLRRADARGLPGASRPGRRRSPAGTACCVTGPHGAFYILADVSRASRRHLRCSLAGSSPSTAVAVAPGETFGPAGAGLVRISLASEPAVLVEGLRRLDDGGRSAGREV